ncbi:unnamed protein product [Rotaria sp. Silwood1]|nr:unnamed protein product [Rotaria sp. Silwood1]
MDQPTNTSNLGPLDNLDFILTPSMYQKMYIRMTSFQTYLYFFEDVIQSSVSTEEIGTRIRYDYNTWESFYEIDVADLNMTLYPDELFKNLLDDIGTLEPSSVPSSTIDEISELLNDDADVFSPIESNDMADRIPSTDEHLAMIKSSDPVLPIARPHIEKSPTKNLFSTSIPLSTSVAVTVPAPNRLLILQPLEDTYRARYKSDYFPQSGTSRRPRYVADKVGNHYVTLQMPNEYKHGFTNEYIRVALITISMDDHGHFYSPYKFQINHRDAKVPDQNPIYIPVQAQKNNNFTMKLQLVLIKSKLDQLNDAQPLIPFTDTITNIQNIINEEKLAPKDLINTYQLEKSHIAFTLCTKLPNGSYDIHPETTVISSVITESSAKQLATSNNKAELSKHFYTLNMTHIQWSVEEYISTTSFDDNDIQKSLALNCDSQDDCHVATVDSISLSCDSIDFIDPRNCGIDKSELDLYFPGRDSSTSTKIETNDHLALSNYIPNSFENPIHKDIHIKSKSSRIPLSESVGVTISKQPQSPLCPIEIAHDLELSYKPRYKSDYFSQDGTIRKPRYVADRIGNHFVTIKVLNGVQGFLRVDWVTIPTKKNIRYSMPYKFQISNESPDVPDSNPIYIPIKADSSGIMQLYLVLIKAKQDELKSLQPLKPFQDIFGASGQDDLKQMFILNPKQLIQTYQLDKSQLAFTFCTLSSNGISYIPEWNTTVYSTVLTEISADNSKKRRTTCPNCSHSFEFTIMTFFNNVYVERISEEAHGDILSSLKEENEVLSELGLDNLFDQDLFSLDFPLSGACNHYNLTQASENPVESYGFDEYLGLKLPECTKDFAVKHDNNHALMNNSSTSSVDNKKRSELNTRPIELSRSVDVGQSQIPIKPSHKIQIVHPLEEFFRPRYKSDYFTYDGKTRKPRYVADRVGNHCVTLKVPLGVSGVIRVDWLTIPTESGNRYSMPYRFQRDNVSLDVSDANPVYISITTDDVGIMRLYLVLIKSKQDELKALQPLKPFHPFQDVFGISDKQSLKQAPPLHPKQLIQSYRLDKSQLAFTFCALGSDGKSFIPEWDTTVYSTVLTEMPLEISKKRALSCPHCAHVFDPTSCGDDNDDVHEILMDQRKVNRSSGEQLIQTTKKRKSIQNDILVLH